MDTEVDPVIGDLIVWLKENLPADSKEEDIFKKVKRLQKVYEKLIDISFGEFYEFALNSKREPPEDEENGQEEEDEGKRVQEEPEDQEVAEDVDNLNVDGDADVEEEDEEEEEQKHQTHQHQQIEDKDRDKLKEDCQIITTLDEAVSEKLRQIRDYICLNEEKLIRTQRLDASRAKLDLKKQQYQLINSIKLDSCMDLISRYNRLMSKK